MTAVPPNAGQITLIVSSVLFLIIADLASLARMRWDRSSLRIAAKSLDYWAILLALGALGWHALSRGSWIPLEDNFEALTAIGIMLALFSMYMQRMRPIPGLDWFLMPIVILMMICAVVFGKVKPDAYRPDSLWAWTHRLSSYGGALAFAVAAGVGCMYLIVSARLRRKTKPPGPQLGSLERLERIAQVSVTLGFGLLTLGMLTGFIKIIHDAPSPAGPGANYLMSPKVVLAVCVWVVYALALHSPINPNIRGRKSAMLSIVGFVLMFGTIIAVQFMRRIR